MVDRQNDGDAQFGRNGLMTRAPIYRRGAGNMGKTLFFFIGFFVTLWAGGLYNFASTLPGSVVDETSKTDAIVVLTGGSGRLDAGVQLLTNNMAAKMFVSGVYKGIEVSTLLNLSQQNPEDLLCCIGIGYAENTIDNALETFDWAKDNKIKSIRLVTSSYHMPRAMLEFENTLEDILIIPNPVFSEVVKQKKWWIWPGTTDLIVSEYNKFILAWLRHLARKVFMIKPHIKNN